MENIIETLTTEHCVDPRIMKKFVNSESFYKMIYWSFGMSLPVIIAYLAVVIFYNPLIFYERRLLVVIVGFSSFMFLWYSLSVLLDIIWYIFNGILFAISTLSLGLGIVLKSYILKKRSIRNSIQPIVFEGNDIITTPILGIEEDVKENKEKDDSALSEQANDIIGNKGSENDGTCNPYNEKIAEKDNENGDIDISLPDNDCMSQSFNSTPTLGIKEDVKENNEKNDSALSEQANDIIGNKSGENDDSRNSNNEKVVEKDNENGDIDVINNRIAKFYKIKVRPEYKKMPIYQAVLGVMTEKKDVAYALKVLVCASDRLKWLYSVPTASEAIEYFGEEVICNSNSYKSAKSDYKKISNITEADEIEDKLKDYLDFYMMNNNI